MDQQWGRERLEEGGDERGRAGQGRAGLGDGKAPEIDTDFQHLATYSPKGVLGWGLLLSLAS